MLQYTKKLRVVPENAQQGQDLAVKIHKKTAELRASPRWKGGQDDQAKVYDLEQDDAENGFLPPGPMISVLDRRICLAQAQTWKERAAHMEGGASLTDKDMYGPFSRK